MRIPMLAIAAAIIALPVKAEEPYLDDRSDPTALVRSLYNAINRKEYARAWSYFSEKPAPSLEAYAEGYADTDSVSVEVGLPSEEGAAGSIYYQLPVAIEARSADGDTQVYGGCYQLRLANPQMQAEDFTPLHIERGQLRSAHGALMDALPASCGDAPPPDPVHLLERRVRALFRDKFKDTCDLDYQTSEADEAFSTYFARFRYSYSSPDEPESEVRLFRFLCSRGAYNESHVYIMADQFDRLNVLSFATPELDIRHEDNDFEKPVESISVIGFRSGMELVNSDFDPATLSISSWAKWRGLGDASSIGTWILRQGEFTLTRYEVDASYDGEINHDTVIDYHSGP